MLSDIFILPGIRGFFTTEEKQGIRCVYFSETALNTTPIS